MGLRRWVSIGLDVIAVHLFNFTLDWTHRAVHAMNEPVSVGRQEGDFSEDEWRHFIEMHKAVCRAVGCYGYLRGEYHSPLTDLDEYKLLVEELSENYRRAYEGRSLKHSATDRATMARSGRVDLEDWLEAWHGCPPDTRNAVTEPGLAALYTLGSFDELSLKLGGKWLIVTQTDLHETKESTPYDITEIVFLTCFLSSLGLSRADVCSLSEELLGDPMIGISEDPNCSVEEHIGSLVLLATTPNRLAELRQLAQNHFGDRDAEN